MIIEQKKINYPWGRETVWADTDNYRASFVGIRSGNSILDNSKISRKETVYVLYGTLVIELDGCKEEVGKGQSFHIDSGIVRSLHAPYGDVDMVVVSE